MPIIERLANSVQEEIDILETSVKILRGGVEFFKVSENWTQHASARTKYSAPCAPNYPAACKFCISGWIVLQRPPESWNIQRMMSQLLHGALHCSLMIDTDIVSYNDKFERTSLDISDLCKLAADLGDELIAEYKEGL